MNIPVTSEHEQAVHERKCPECGTMLTLRYTYLWANQYGYCIRYFCPCGLYLDSEMLYRLKDHHCVRAGDLRISQTGLPF